MMLMVETCPRCGHDLIHLVLTSNPPIEARECPMCLWYWQGKREDIVRIPFKDSGRFKNNGSDNYM